MSLYLLEFHDGWWRLRREGKRLCAMRDRNRQAVLEAGVAMGWKIADASPEAVERDEFGRSVAEQDRDLWKACYEEENICHIEVANGLAYAVGDDPPRFCANDCTFPHLGSKGMEAIKAAHEARRPLPQKPEETS